jgi:hypothetical protein
MFVLDSCSKQLDSDRLAADVPETNLIGKALVCRVGLGLGSSWSSDIGQCAPRISLRLAYRITDMKTEVGVRGFFLFFSSFFHFFLLFSFFPEEAPEEAPNEHSQNTMDEDGEDGASAGRGEGGATPPPRFLRGRRLPVPSRRSCSLLATLLVLGSSAVIRRAVGCQEVGPRTMQQGRARRDSRAPARTSQVRWRSQAMVPW